VSDVVDADGLLHLLAAEPTLLPPAPADADIERRRHDEVHSCLRCGQRAQAALIADTKPGRRWLDLCMNCFTWARTSARG
jgi:hypothetical protein